MRVSFYSEKDSIYPMIKEFDSLIYNNHTDEARFFNSDSSLYVCFYKNDINEKLTSYVDYSYVDYDILRKYVLLNGGIDLTAPTLVYMGNIYHFGDIKVDAQFCNIYGYYNE